MNHVDLKQFGYTQADIVEAENIAKQAAMSIPPTYMAEHGIVYFQPHSWVVLAVLRALNNKEAEYD